MKTKLFVLLITTILFHFESNSQNYEVGHTTITFNDPSRSGGYGSGGGPGRQIRSEIYYPADVEGNNVEVASGDFPVVAFGHGFVMRWDAYKNIWTNLVAQGYILVFPRTEGGFSPSHENFGKDLAICISKMQDLNNESGSLFFGHVGNTSAVAGHSMGGGSAFIAAKHNSNITTIIGLAPAETNPSAIAAASDVSIPALVMSGEKDGVTPSDEHHIPIYDALSSSCKYFINITGGAHCYFANSNFNCDFGERFSSRGISISRTAQQNTMNDYFGKWLDYQLKGDASAYAAFNSLLSSDSRITFQNDCDSGSRIGVIGENSKSKSLDIDSDIMAYPNPVTNYVNISLSHQMEEVNLTMLNLIGQTLLTKTYHNQREIKLNVEDLKPGTYLIKVNYNTETKLLKLVKQ